MIATVLVILGGAVVVILLALAVIFFLNRDKFLNKEKDEDSARTEQTTAQTSDELSFDEIEEVEQLEAAPAGEDATVSQAYLPQGSYFASGHLSDLPCSVDFTIGADGNVTGTFWNILYDVKLPVAGYIDSNGSLALDLGSGSTLSHMALSAAPGTATFRGVWGKNKKPVSLDVRRGSRDTSVTSSGGTKVTIKGGGMTTHGRISQTSYGDYRLTFDNQPQANALPCRISDGTVYIDDLWTNGNIAYFHLPGSSLDDYGSSTLYITNGKEFTITLGS